MIRPNLTCKKFFMAVVLSFFIFSLMAADRYSVSTGRWDQTSRWSATSGGSSGASVPGAGDNVYIEGGYTVRISNANASCANISIAAGSTLDARGYNLTVGGTTTVNGSLIFTNSNSGTKTFTGLVTINGSWTNNTVNSPVNFRGGITNNGTLTAGTGIYTFNTNNQSLAGTLSIPNVTVTDITLTNNGTLTAGTDLNGNGGLTQGINATLNIGGTSGITTLTASNNGNTVNFDGAAQSVNPGSYYNLTTSGSGIKTMQGNTAVGGTLTLTSGALSIGANTLTLSNAANLSYGAGSMTGGATSTLIIGTGAAITLNAISGGLNNFNVSRNITLGADLSINGTLALTAGTFAVAGYTLTLNGPTIAGTPSNLSATSSSSLVFGGTSAGVLIPTSVAALNGLSITNTNIVSLQSSPTISGTFNPAGGGLSIGANTLTLNGQINCGTLVGGATSNIIIGGSGTANLPIVTLNNLTVNRAVSICGNVTVGGTLTLTSGALSIGANTLTLSNAANLSYGAGSMTGGATSNLTIGTGAAITLNAISGGLNNFNVSRNITLGADLSINGTLALTAGTFAVAGYTLTLNGPTIAGTPSNLSTTSSSSLVFGGTSAGVLIPTSVTALNGLSITNTNIVSLQSSPTVSGIFNPTGAGLSIGANTLTLNGQINCGTLVGGATSNIIIGGSGSASLPGVILNNLTVNRAVSLCGNVTVGGTLTLTSGALSIGANTLTLSNAANLSYGAGSLTGGTTSNLTIGTGAAITLNAISGGLNNFNVSRNITLGADLSINGTLTLTAGTFAVAGYTLALNGPTIAGTPSNLSTTSLSSLVFGGTSASVLIPTSVTALNGLSITNTSIVSLQSSPTVSGIFNPSGAGLSIGANTLTLNGQINCGTLVGGATSNIIIGGSGTASLSAVTLNNLTVNRAVSLCGNVTVGGTLTLTSGAFTVGANTLTLNGPTIAGTPSNLSTSSSSNLIFGGSSAGVQVPSSVANLNNLTVNNSSGITLTGNITIAGTLTMTQGNITTGTNILIISNSAAGSLIRTSGTIIGRLRRSVNTPLSTDYLFPIGTAAYYRPAVMNFSSLSAGTSIIAEFIATPPAGFTTYTDDIAYLNNTFSEGYWRFASSGLPAATYSLKLTGSGFTSYTLNQLTRITGRDNTNTNWRALGVHGTWSGNDVSRNGVTNLNSTSFDFAFATGCNITLLGYGNERNITIDYTKVSGGSDLYSFPVLVTITGQDFLKNSPAGQIFNGNGYDIIFTDNNYNKLDHQLEYYNGINGDLIAWIRVPTLSSSSNTVIKILYGNLQVNTDPSVTSVWDSHYKGVWHLDDNTLDDFTSFDKPGTPYNTPTYPSGRIYNALGLNGTNEYAEVLNAPNTNFAGNVTVSAWVYMDAGGRDQKIAGNQNNSSGGYKFGIYTNNKVEFEIRNSANTPSLNRDVAGGTVLSTGQWYYLAGISSDVLDSIKTFVNGIPERPFKKTGILGTASNNLTIGKEPFLSNYYFDGMFDELRISDKVRSNGWMRTEYNNQSSPSTFYALGAGAVTNNLPSAGICNVPLTLTFGYPTGGTYSGNPYISGNVFNPPSAGTYSITYTYDGGCGPIGITKNIVITPVPSAPTASSKEYCSNQIANLEATSGTNIRWYSGGTLVSTANPFSTGQTTAGTYNYTVTQTVNGCESPATSVTMTIYSGITVNTQPQPVSICAGDNAVFSVSATGLNLTYRWQEDGVNISEGGIYSGSATPTLTLTNPGIAKTGKQYRCVISASCGSSPVNSNTALLTVTVQPVATFSYIGTPYCPNAANPFPTFSGGGVAGTFSSAPGLVFVSTSTGQINLSASNPGTYTVTNTIAAAGGCPGVTADSPITISATLSWTGAASTDWNATGNWSCGLIPTQTLSVQIPNLSNKPVLSTGSTGSVNNLTIEAGSSLIISGNTLQISGTITNNGTIDASDGTISMNGSTAQTIGASVFSGNTVRNISVSNAAGVTLLGPLNVTGIVNIQNGALASAGNLTLVSSASGTALIDGAGAGTVTGNVTMQRYLPSAFGYKYVSSPFQASTVNEFADELDLSASFPVLYRYNESSTTTGWADYVTTTDPLNPLEGYAANFGSSAAPVTANVTGAVNSGALSVTLYNHNNTYTKGFNLTGNPYPSPINWDAAAGWTKTNIDNALYYFKASATDEYGGKYSTYINGVSSDDTVSNIIPSMQGFFVHVTNGPPWPVTGTLSLDNNVRVTDLTHAFAKSTGKSSIPLLRLGATFDDDPLSTDPMVIYFDEKADTGFDSNLDALKLMNTDYTVPNLYAIGTDGSKLSIDALPELREDTICSIPLGIRLNRDGYIIFRLIDVDQNLSGKKIYISDMASGTEYDLLDKKEYRVYVNTGEYLDRFFINLSSVATGIPEIVPDDRLFSVYASNGIIKYYVNTDKTGPGTLSVINLTGQVLFVKRIFNSGYNEFNPLIKNGIYIVTFVSENYRVSKKIFIQNR